MSRACENLLWIFYYTKENFVWRNFPLDSRATRSTSKQKLRKKIYRSCQPLLPFEIFSVRTVFTQGACALPDKQRKTFLDNFIVGSHVLRLKSATTRCFAFTWTMMQPGCRRLNKKKWKIVTKSRLFYFRGIWEKRVGKQNCNNILKSNLRRIYTVCHFINSRFFPFWSSAFLTS